MHLKLFSCYAFSISPGLLSLFQVPVEEAEKNGWCVSFGHCQRQAHSRINSVLPNDHQLPHCQGRGPSVCRITVARFGYAGKHAGVFLLASLAGGYRFLSWVTPVPRVAYLGAAGMPDLACFGFSLQNYPCVSPCYGEKDVKEESRMKLTRVLYPL